MINRILMEFYDDYVENNNIDSLVEFAKKTFPYDGTDSLFVGCVLILFSIAGGYKPRYFCTRENLLAVMLLAKEKVGNSNLLEFYVDRVNKEKGINKYLKDVVISDELDNYADIIISYLDSFKIDLVSEIKKHNSLNDYINTK